MSLALRYAERCGVTFDVAINVLLGGLPFQTCSYRAAVAQRDGRVWGCWLFWVLSRVVQRDHCALQFTDAPASALVYLRAGIAFAAVLAPIGAIVCWLV